MYFGKRKHCKREVNRKSDALLKYLRSEDCENFIFPFFSIFYYPCFLSIEIFSGACEVERGYFMQRGAMCENIP